jgi:hypothetical protein
MLLEHVCFQTIRRRKEGGGGSLFTSVIAARHNFLGRFVGISWSQKQKTVTEIQSKKEVRRQEDATEEGKSKSKTRQRREGKSRNMP